jgi:hypothetical protein
MHWTPVILSIPAQVCYLNSVHKWNLTRFFFLKNQLYQREEEVVKEVTKEDDDARVGCKSQRIQIFCESTA